eukprot:1171750-Amphidinium_carterae.1
MEVQNSRRGTQEERGRARLTVRGFKATRLAHRVVVGECALRKDRKLASLDIKKAFLQGATYAKLAAEGTGVVKEVCFEVPPSTISILRCIEGYETFDPRVEDQKLEILWNSKRQLQT